jgi:CheY-like chemotaxis protein
MRILVVDDERECGMVLFRMLRRLGHDPVLVCDGADALAVLDDAVHGVVTDLEMPGMSGVELALSVRARYGDMPIVFCSGSPDHGITRQAADLGPVLPKVTSLDDARRVLRHVEAGVPGRRAVSNGT